VKKPLRRNRPIDSNRMGGWLSEFTGYRYPVSEGTVDRWVDQFGSDKDLAARVLDCVDFIANQQMVVAFRYALEVISGWHPNKSKRKGKWRFLPFSSSAGTSGDSMLYHFRMANQLTGRANNGLFIHIRDLMKEDLGPEDSVVFVDDFAGTGSQACESWSMISELLPGDPKIYLALPVVSHSARKRIEDETGMSVISYIQLEAKDNVFSKSCKMFTEKEKGRLLQLCKKACRKTPKGYGDCGFVVVFTHKTPNNTIPILHANNKKWRGLFRRHD
jgi:hypothetical protein